MEIRAASISIGGVPIFGWVGYSGTTTMSVGDCWLAYVKWLEKQADGPFCPLKAVWEHNGKQIEEPDAWFVTLGPGGDDCG